MCKALTLFLMDAKSDLPVEDPSVFGAEKLEVDGRVVAAHLAPSSYLPSCRDVFCIALRDPMLSQKVRYKELYFIWRRSGAR